MSSSVSYELFQAKFLQNAQFLVDVASMTNANPILYSTVFINGTNISKPTASTIALASGHMYLVSYNFLYPTNSAVIQVTPRFNTVLKPQFAIGNAVNTINGGSCTFLADASIASIILDFIYNSPTISTPNGSVSIVQIT